MSNNKSRLALAASLLVAGATIYGSVGIAHGPGQGDPNGNLEPLTKEIEQGDRGITFETVATGLIAPNWGISAPGVAGRLFVTDQNGILWSIDLSGGAKTVFLDVTNRLVNLGIFGPGSFDERGLLGVAFHPGYATNGLLYTYTSEPNAGPADFSTMPQGETADHQSVIAEWQVADPTDPASAVDIASRREVLRIDQPQFNHDGGALDFGPDGMLYIALGDGGGADDVAVGHGDLGNGQDPSTVLGAILRIDPEGVNAANGRYGIPGDNPFVGKAGFLDEIFAYGFRNPYRMSFDSATGALYVGDVGQNDIEEVDVVVAGGNYGWNLKEGSFFFDPDGDRNGNGFASPRNPRLGNTRGLIDPVAEYDTHIDGHSVIGGFVYRGSEIEGLQGHYVFGEFAKTIFFGSGLFTNARVFFLEKSEIVGKKRISKSDIIEFHYAGGVTGLPYALLGFGQDANGELYFLANTTGTPFGAGEDRDIPTGVVLKIVGADE